MSDPISIKTQSDLDRLWARSLLYQILAELFRHPASRGGDPRGEDFAGWQEAAAVLESAGDTSLMDSLQRLIAEIKRTQKQAWISHYENCFGHTARGPVSCYELEYGEEHSHRQPQQLGDITAFYNAFGLKMNAKLGERADHISVECGFMHYLLFKEAHALANGGQENAGICQEASRRFLSEHLGFWVPSFSIRLSLHAGTGIMKEIADFVFAFVCLDCRQSGIAPGPGDLPLRAVSREETECVSCPSSSTPS